MCKCGSGTGTPTPAEKSMPVEQDISNKEIYNELQKIIPFTKGRKNPESFIVKHLRLEFVANLPYRKIKFDLSSYCRLYLFMKIKNITSQTDAVLYLRQHKQDRRRLGFKSTPTQTTISYFLNNILDPTVKAHLDYTAFRIEQIAAQNNLLLTPIKLELKKQKTRTKHRNQQIRKKQLSRNAIKFYKRRILPFISLKLGKNCVYKTNHFTNLLLYMAKENDFANNGSEDLRDEIKTHGIRCPKCSRYIPSFEIQFSETDPENTVICHHCEKKFRISPNSQTMFYHLKKLTEQDLQHLYYQLLEVFWEQAKKQNLFKERPLTLAIDCTSVIYYGDRNTPGSVTTADDTKRMSYRYMTINICENGRRFVLMAIPITDPKNQTKKVNELLQYAQQRVNIGLVLLDKGFYSADTIKMLEVNKFKYIISCPKNPRVQKKIDLGQQPVFYENYDMKDVVHHLVLNSFIGRDGKESVAAYATNLPLDSNDIEGSVKNISSTYHKRWGIETSYRVIKGSFGLRTTSKDFRIRLFYFLFSTILYNLWILIDMLVWIDSFNEIGEKRLVTANSYRLWLFVLDPGG